MKHKIHSLKIQFSMRGNRRDENAMTNVIRHRVTVGLTGVSVVL